MAALDSVTTPIRFVIFSRKLNILSYRYLTDCTVHGECDDFNTVKRMIKQSSKTPWKMKLSVLWIWHILLRIRMQIRGSVPLSNGPRCGSGRPRNNGFYGSGSGCRSGTRVKSHIAVNQGFSHYFCLTMEGSGSVLVTNGSGCGSGRPKNTRIHNTGNYHQRKNFNTHRPLACRGGVLNGR